jgi:hypothetical protein
MGQCNICGDCCCAIRELSCNHEVCDSCLEEYINTGINTRLGYIECPIYSNCQLLSDELIEEIVSDKQYNKMRVK